MISNVTLDFICRMRYESTKELNYGELNGIKFGFEDHVNIQLNQLGNLRES